MAEVLDRRRQLRRYALYGTAALMVGGVAYKAYSSDAVWQTRRSLTRLRAALKKYSEALSSSADLCCTLVRDLQSFLQSDSSELPASLQQLAKLLQSPEVMRTTTNTVAAVYRGVAGDRAASSSTTGEGALDKVLAALLSDRGHSLVSVAVSMGARNLVGAWVEASSRIPAQQLQRGAPAAASSLQQGTVDKLLDFITTERGQQLAVTAITAFVTNGMRVYMDATLDINFYEDIFSSMARPQHLEAVKQCIGMFAREAVGTAMQGSPPRQTTPRSRATLIQELSPPGSPGSPGAAGSLHFWQQGEGAEQCGDGRGSPLDSAYRSPSPGAGSLMGDEATSNSMRQIRQRRQQQHQGSGGEASGNWAGAAAPTAADDLDSDSLLYSRRDAEGKGVAAEQPAPSGPAWLPMVTKEVLTMAKDQNARTLVVGAVGAAAGASAREVCAAAVVGLGQLEVVRRWGTRGLVALLLLTFLTACLIQELLRAAVLAAVH